MLFNLAYFAKIVAAATFCLSSCVCLVRAEKASLEAFSGTPSLRVSKDFEVTVDGRKLVVYESLKTGTHGTNGITRMSFVGFDLARDVTAKISVKTMRNVSEARLHPKLGAPVLWVTTKETGTEGEKESIIEFKVDQPQHLTLVTESGWEGVLIISINPPDTPPDPAKVAHYFFPGVHRIGPNFKISSGEEVYLAEGAIIEGGFKLDKVENVKIHGRGILALGRWPHKQDFGVIKGSQTKNILIDGITITNSPGWIISFWGGSEDLTINNVKILGNWFYNTDGVQTGTVRLRVENSFLECNDDNFSLNGVSRDVVIRNNVLWNIYNGGVFMLGWGCQELRNIRIEANTIIRAGGCCQQHPKGPFSMVLTNKKSVVDGVLFKDIVVEDILKVSHWLNFSMEAQGEVRNIRFENIEIQSSWATLAEIRGFSAENQIEGISFKNLSIKGKAIRSAAEAGLKSAYTRKVTFGEWNNATE